MTETVLTVLVLSLGIFGIGAFAGAVYLERQKEKFQ